MRRAAGAGIQCSVSAIGVLVGSAWLAVACGGCGSDEPAVIIDAIEDSATVPVELTGYRLDGPTTREGRCPLDGSMWRK